MYSQDTRTSLRTLRQFCEHLKEIEFVPRTIIDVGVASYTEGIYAFREADFYLFEPLQEYKEAALKLLDGRCGKLFSFALSDCNSVQLLNVNPEAPDTSALVSADDSTHNTSSTRQVEVRRLDSIMSALDIQRPCLLKIDVQGHDFEVLVGAGELLSLVDVVIFEFMCFGKHSLAEYVDLMKMHGLEFYEIISPLRRPYDDALSQVDFIFVRSNCSLRSYLRYR